MRDDIFGVEEHSCDVCVVGGGMAGLAVALAAARHGAKVALIHERPVLGGNASSECRVHIGGADIHNGIKHMRETGIVEEIQLENVYRNPLRSWGVWDSLLYEKAHFEPNVNLILNCSVMDATTEDGRIVSVTGWQLTTQKYLRVSAKVFVDCSGDSILAPLVGAEFRIGREARSEFDESHEPEQADRRTMGMTCLFQAREYDTPQPFTPPAWAHRFQKSDIPHAIRHIGMGYWWVELGGEDDSIADTERLRDELLKITWGVWDFIKNVEDHGADNWAVEWIQFLPAKRESRRYVGDHVLTQNDIEARGRFDDIAAYGGWSMDDHDIAGFRCAKLGRPSTIFHKAPSPYGIPYRSMYSRNVPNLMFAGRNISATHMALSSTRVIGTCMSIGQAVGTAAAMAIRDGISPREVGRKIGELQQTLLSDDAYIPWLPQEFSALTTEARLTASRGNPEPVRDGTNRQVGDDPHGWSAAPGEWIAYEFGGKRDVALATLALDSGMDELIAMSYHVKQGDLRPPRRMPRRFRIEGLVGGRWETVAEVADNHQRFVRVPVGRALEGVRFVMQEAWGEDVESMIYAFYLE